MQAKIFILFNIISFLFFLSCSPNEVQDSSVDFPTALKTNSIIHNVLANKLIASTNFNQVDLALITYLRTNDYNNLSLVEPEVIPSALAIAKYKEKISSISINEDELLESSPLIFPGYFTSYNWTKAKHNYNYACNWQINYSKKLLNVNSIYQSPIFKINIEGDDTIRPNSQILVRWNKTSNNVNINSKVYIYFKWFPSYLKLNNPKTYIGIDAEDTGIFATTYNKLKELDIPLYGILQINIIRFSIDIIEQNGFNLLVSNIVESSVSANIKK